MQIKFNKFGIEVQVRTVARYKVIVAPKNVNERSEDWFEGVVDSVKSAVALAEEVSDYRAVNSLIAHSWVVYKVSDDEVLTYVTSGDSIPELEIKLVKVRH